MGLSANGLVEVYDAAQRCYMPGYLRDIEKNKMLALEPQRSRPLLS